MTTIVASLVLLGILLINLLVNGLGAWGTQPGGRLSMWVLILQVLVSIFAIFWCIARGRKGKCKNMFSIVVSLLVVVSVVSLYQTGWQAFTSIHGQGAENLVFFLSTFLIAVVIGGHMRGLKKK